MSSYIAYVDTSTTQRSVDLAQSLDAHWARFGNRTLLWMAAAEWKTFTRKAREVGWRVAAKAGQTLVGQPYLVIQVGAAFQQDHPAARILLEQGRYLVVDLSPTEVAQLATEEEVCWAVRPLPSNSVILETLAPARRAVVPWVQTLVDQLTQATYSSYLTTLASHPTRHSLSPHFLSAATWARDQLRQLGYQADLRTIPVGNSSSYNVVAERSGQASGLRDLVVITAHLDSINHGQGVNAPARGADDNASGCAGLLEMARIFANHPAQADLRLILFGGEEQGLRGSNHYVASLSASDRARIRAVINMDMIATRNTPTPTVLLEGAPISQALMTTLAEAAATYTGLTVQTTLTPFGSDHVPFINALLPALLTIEGADSANTNIHTANDTLAHIDYALALEILRMNVAATASVLGRAESPSTERPGASGRVVAWGSDRLDVFVLGTDSAVYHKWWDGANWGPSVVDYEYMGGVCASPPEAVAWGPNRLDLFVLGTDRALYHKWWDGANWGPSLTDWEYMGGVCMSPPKIVSWGPNRLDVFVIGTNRALYHKWWDGANWGPSLTDWEYMGGVCISPPEVVAWGPNRLDVFVIGTDRALYHKWWDGANWGPSVVDWEYMGGICTSPPKVVSWGPNRLDVFVTGTDSALYHKWWDGANWGPSVVDYEYMGGICTSPPEVVAWGPNRLDVFVTGTDSALYHKWWDGANWGPSLVDYEYMGGICTSPPRVATWGPNRLDVFVTGTDSALYHKWWDGANWGPSLVDYEYMGGVIQNF